MHACGHDFHMALILTSAKILSEIKNNLKEIGGKRKIRLPPVFCACLFEVHIILAFDHAVIELSALIGTPAKAFFKFLIR